MPRGFPLLSIQISEEVFGRRVGVSVGHADKFTVVG